MSSQADGLNKLGGFSFIISGTLFLVKYLLDLATGPPPANGIQILAWMAAKHAPLAWISEVMFFAVMFLIPGVIALYRSLADIDRPKAVLGCGIMAATIPMLSVLVIVHGRLVYSIYNIEPTHDPATAELLVSLFWGGLHAAGILLGVATIVLSLALPRAGYGSTIIYLGVATGVFDVVGGYPGTIGLIPMMISQALFAAWFVAVGWKLRHMPWPAARG